MSRKYPSYTLADLEKFVAEGRGNTVMAQEIADRKSGVSQCFVTPQVAWAQLEGRVADGQPPRQPHYKNCDAVLDTYNT
jgi:hypothetical protein